jgi:hypothetical protein
VTPDPKANSIKTMARCAYCSAETQLYENETAICVRCAELSLEKRAVRVRLFRDLHDAVKIADLANENFVMATIHTPNGNQHSDGTQRIHNASRQLTAARMEMMKAHNRLNDFLNTGIVPDDLRTND